MNTDVLDNTTPRYEKLAKPRRRIDRNSNHNAFDVKAGALSYQITDSLNKLAQPKRRPQSNVSAASDLLVKSTQASTVKYGTHKLINSDQQSKDAQESQKKKFLLDTYARIVAARNKRCSKRLQDLARPKDYSNRAEPCEDFDNYFQRMNKYNARQPSILPKRANV